MNVKVRQARQPDATWIEQRYTEVGFAPVDLARDFVAIAEVLGTPAGLARVSALGGHDAELGGIYVLPEYREIGVARKLVEFLLESNKAYSTIWCLPFEHLREFFDGYGFHTEIETWDIPHAIVEKHSWCNRTYPVPVLLLGRRAGETPGKRLAGT